MTIKVIIERKFKEAPIPENFQVINKLRRVAIHQKGYVTGETLVNFEDNYVVILSVWASLEDWKTWLFSPRRAELENELTPYLKEPLKTRQFITGADYIREAFA